MLPALGRLEYDPRKPQPILDLCTFFRSRTVHLNIIKVFYLPTDAQENCFNPLNAELNPICYLLALLAYHFLHVSRIRVKSLTHRLLMSYTRAVPKLMPPIYFHGNHNRYQEHNNAV